MSVATALLHARYIGIRELREHLSKRFKEEKPIIVTEHGTPTKVILSYKDVLEFLEVFDELQDRGTIHAVREGRKAIRQGGEGISVSDLFNQIRQSRK